VSLACPRSSFPFSLQFLIAPLRKTETYSWSICPFPIPRLLFFNSGCSLSFSTKFRRGPCAEIFSSLVLFPPVQSLSADSFLYFDASPDHPYLFLGLCFFGKNAHRFFSCPSVCFLSVYALSPPPPLTPGIDVPSPP